MVAYLVEHFVFVLIFWGVCALLGLWIKLINARQLRMGDVIMAVVFGFFYFVTQAWEWEAVIIELPPRK